MNIKVNNVVYPALAIESRLKDTAWKNRDSKAIILAMSYADAMELFVNDVEWKVETTTYNSNGEAIVEYADMSNYAIAGPVTDNRDGTVTVKMGRYLQDEIMMIPLTEVPSSHKVAKVWREVIETAMQSIENDQVARVAAPLYPTWDNLVALGTAVEVGFRFSHAGDLYKVLQAHTLSTAWVPGMGTETLYVRIDETHAGTAADPIPYNGNMELVNGLYYVQDGVVYKCIRSTSQPIYHALSSLIGLHVEVAE